MAKPLFKIIINDDGTSFPTDLEDCPLQELNTKELAESLEGRQIRQAAILPTATLLRSNPGWVQLGRSWYYLR